MKKAYTKPEIVIENFLLSEHIAACSGKDEFLNNVGTSMDDLIGFANALTSKETCDLIVQEGYEFAQGDTFYCYFTSAAGSTIFSS